MHMTIETLEDHTPYVTGVRAYKRMHIALSTQDVDCTHIRDVWS